MNNILRNEKGIAIGTIMLVIALIGVIVAAFSMANKTSSSTAAEQSQKVLGATIMQEGSNIKSGFDKMLGNGISISQITWDITASTGLFHPTDGGAVKQTVPADALVTTTNGWVYKVNGSLAPVIQLKGIGIDANKDYLIAVADIKVGVCQQINKILYGSTTIPQISTTALATAANWNTAATAFDLSTDSAVDGKAEGCVQTFGETKYVYYKTILEQ